MYAKDPPPEAEFDVTLKLLKLALPKPDISDCTNAVVASCVVLVLAAAVGPVGVPVSAGLARGAFKAILSVTVVEKLASSFNAAASSFRVSKLPGAESTRFATCVFTYEVVAKVEVSAGVSVNSPVALL